MLWKLRHPWWIHAPALALYAAMLIALERARPLPERLPMQFGWNGEPVRWGAPWEAELVFVVVPLVIIALGFAAGESWARQQRGGRFNPMALFDAIVIGLIAGTEIPWLGILAQGEQPRFMPPWPWQTMLALPLAGAAVAVVLERLRPWHPPTEQVQVEEVSNLSTEIAARIRAGERWAYWEAQNPPYVSLLVFGVSTLLFLGAWQIWKHVTPWLAVEVLAAAAFVLLCYGGIRVSVTKHLLQVRLGMLGLRLLRMPLTDVNEVAVHTFSPLADFGGWGIRVNRQMKAFYFRGNRGVRLRTHQGKQYLIGSDHPERLCAAITAARAVGQAVS